MKNKINFIFLVLIIAAGNFFLVSLSLQNQINQKLFLRPVHFELQQNYAELKKILGHPEPMARAAFSDEDIEITLRGFRTFKSTEIDVVFQKSLHATERLGLYSLNYIAKLITDPEIHFSSAQLNVIEDLLTITLEHIEKLTLLTDRMKYNDHVVSARLESLLLLKAFFKEQNHLHPKLEERIDKHIRFCVLELVDDKKFTWRTNHGLMQIRALLAFDFAMEENPLTQKVRNAIAERLEDHVLLDFHIAADGSVFEAATGYWRYVYSQWEAISAFSLLKNDTILQNRLERTKHFLAAVSTSDGFMQGVGDSYSSYSNPRNNNIELPVNYTYRFGNGIAGANIIDGNKNNLYIKFVSLDNPPHVKKHPEDLAVYIYLNQPYFMNPGTYAWENSSQRRHVLSQNVQNTFYNPNYSNPDSSAINKNFSGKNIISFEGTKWYDAEKLERRIIIDLENSTIQIIDWGPSDNLITGFNIHPDVSISTIDSLTYQLTGKDNAIHLHSNIPGRIKKEKISDSYNSLIEVDRLEFETDSLILNFAISDFDIINKVPVVINDADKTFQRIEAGELLARKYWKNEFFKTPSPKRLIYPRFFILASFLMLIVILPKKYNWSIGLLYVLFSVVDVFMNGWLFSLLFL